MSAAEILNLRPEPATHILTGRQHVLDDMRYVTLIDLALGNDTRSHRQQAVLESECAAITNVFCDWLQQARDTWKHQACEGCGITIEKHALRDRCDDCRWTA